MDIVAKTISCLFILILLIVVEPWLAISTALVLGTFFGMIYWVVRKKLALWGAQSLNANMFRYKLTSEAMGGIKDLLVLGRQHDFLHRYSYYARRNAGFVTKNGTVALVPMYAIEILAFGGILGIVLYFIGTKQNIAHVLPFVALYAFAAKRILPALQGVFASISTIRYNLSWLDVVCDDLMQTTGSASALRLNSDLKTLEFLNSICLKNISFSYPGREERVINALSCEIKANTTVGFVGPTGSGKTTLIDIILGLLVPQVGQLQIDGIPVHKENCTRWQRNIGYVSQHIYLSDDTVARNIAFGIPDEHIELEKVKKAAAIANISRFIEGELPSSYDTLIGERGVRLSGGQRQRIGIARALYHDPDVLILDEATSALDGETESAVMDAIAALSSKKTIIIIAHRLTTLKDCDVIHVLENGRITAQGTYNELIQFSDRFRAMSRIATK